MTKTEEINTAEIFFLLKIAIYLFLGLCVISGLCGSILFAVGESGIGFRP
jgi:hypothetical protein